MLQLKDRAQIRKKKHQENKQKKEEKKEKTRSSYSAHYLALPHGALLGNIQTIPLYQIP